MEQAKHTHGWDTKELAGIGFLVGNAALFINGLLAYLHGDTTQVRKAGMGRMVSSAAWNGGALVLTHYGNIPVDKQFARLSGKLAEHLQAAGVSLDGQALREADAQTRRGWFGKLDDFIATHPMETTNMFNSAAAAGMLTSGILRRRRGEIKAGNANIGISALLFIGSLILMFTPERTPEQIRESGQEGTLWGTLQKRPLAFAMPAFLAADASFAVQAWGEHVTGKQLTATSTLKPYASLMSWLSVGVMACFFGGDVLSGVSSKKMHGAPDELHAAQEKIIAAAAQMLGTLPIEQQRAMAHEAAGYMAKQQWLRMVELKPRELEARILAAVAKHSPSPKLPATHVEAVSQSQAGATLSV